MTYPSCPFFLNGLLSFLFGWRRHNSITWTFFLSWVANTQLHHETKQVVRTRLRWGWVFLERTQILSGIQFSSHFIDFFVVETKHWQFVGSFVNVILARQTCGQLSSRAAESKRRALGNSFCANLLCVPKYQNVKETEI